MPDKSGGYTAHIPALGIVTEGETLKEAKVMARDAIEGWIEVTHDLGKRIPADNRDLKLGTLRGIIQQAGWTVEEFVEKL